jgi:hypothetical protein
VTQGKKRRKSHLLDGLLKACALRSLSGGFIESGK